MTTARVGTLLVWWGCCAALSAQASDLGRDRTATMALGSARATVPAHLVLEAGGHGAAVRRLAVDAARDWVVSASDDKTARVWRLSTGELLHTLRVPVGPGEQGRLYGAAIHPVRAEVVVAGTGLAPLPGAPTDAVARVFALDSGRLRASFRLCRCEVKRLAWSADGRMLVAGAAGAERGVHAFDAEGRSLGRHLTEGDVFGLSMRGAQLLATDMAGRLLVFGLEGGVPGAPRVLKSPGPAPVSVSHSPDGVRAVVGHFSAQPPSIVELARGAVVRTLQPRDSGLDAGQLMTVAWSADGRRVYAGGRKARGREYLLWSFDAASGEAAAGVPVAADSLLDLVPLPGGPMGEVAFASFDGSWGVFDGRAVSINPVSAFGGAQSLAALLVGPDATLVSWQMGGAGDVRLQFDLRQRRLAQVERGVGRGPRQRRGGPFSEEIQVGDARGRFTGFYRLGGRDVPLEPGETARAASFMPDAAASSDAIVGTSRALMRVDAQGRPLWRRALGAEVNALVVAADGHHLVTAASDGTVRWWNAASGEPLLALLALPSGRWLAWTPEGYFDASAGGDSLAGWLVRPLGVGSGHGDNGAGGGTSAGGPNSANSAQGGGRVEFHPLARFRAVFRRPDLVDAAVGVAAKGRAAVDPTGASAGAGRGGAPAVATLVLPPQLVPLDARRAKVPPGGRATLAFALRGSEPAGTRVVVRLNGRPWEPARVDLPAQLDGEAGGRAEIALPPGRHLVQLIARDAHGTSAPLDFNVEVAAKPGEPPPRPRLLALAVGISEYGNRSIDLWFAAKDATDFQAALMAMGGRRYSAVTTRLLTDRQATRPALLQALQWLAGEAAGDDVVIVFLAGHGGHDDEGRYHFITHDADLARLRQTAVSEGELSEALAAIRGRIVLFADTCHAGSVATAAAGSTAAVAAAVLARDQGRLADELRAPENGVIVLAASTRAEESLEMRSLGNGIFTKTVVEGLRGRADLLGRGEVTVKGLDYYVASQVAAMTKAAQNPVSLIPPGMPDFKLIELGR